MAKVGRQKPKTSQFKGIREVLPKSNKQKEYLDAITNKVITFGIGPAGTGKTFLAVYQALRHLWSKQCRRIIITRPVIEAGEKLGFLPGDINAKLDPYIRPIFDSMIDIIGFDELKLKIDKGVIEIAPLAFMRGRAQPLHSLIATPQGFVRMGDVKVGMSILGSDGKTSEITGIFPQGPKSIYRVSFNDGTSTLCSEDHMWVTKTLSEKRHNKDFSIKTTDEIRDSLLNNFRQKNHEIPINSAPCEFMESLVPIDPYLLGVLLGDGCLHEKASISFVTTDEEIKQEVIKVLPVGVRLVQCQDGISYRCSYEKKKGNPLRRKLEELQLVGTKSFNKFVPYIYKFNSVSVRFAVLQGLLDTDGSVMTHRSGRSRVQFYSTSEQLIDDVRLIVQSLGGTATKLLKKTKGQSHISNGREIRSQRDCFILDIRLPKGMKPFRLSRKLDKFSETPAPQRLISSIDLVGFEECQCISVDAPDHLYLTDNFILTHNTFNDSFVIVDESQNCTYEQLKMAITRLGHNTKCVVNGDPTQSDLQNSGLTAIMLALASIDDVAAIRFSTAEIERSDIVKKIVKAIDKHENR